jgi:phosphatidate cytidylyltransferase
LCAIAFRESEAYGLVVVFFILLLVWSFDIAGYFFGKTFGGPKLWPLVSPKKTWSGFFGGLFAASFICLILGLKHAEIHPLSIIFVGLCLVIAAQAGDLFESAIKRHVKVKDSSSILPGHGGVMDRIDGLIAAVLIAFIIAKFNNSADGLAQSLLYFNPV